MSWTTFFFLFVVVYMPIELYAAYISLTINALVPKELRGTLGLSCFARWLFEPELLEADALGLRKKWIMVKVLAMFVIVTLILVTGFSNS